jgi:preprotein translocase subunit SecE
MAKKAQPKTKLEKSSVEENKEETKSKSKSEKAKKSEEKGTKPKKNETKKASAKDGKDSKNKGGIRKYFRDLRSEIKKVVWPSKEKVVNNTGVVLAVVAICGIGLFGIDSLLAVAINALLGIGA